MTRAPDRPQAKELRCHRTRREEGTIGNQVKMAIYHGKG